MKKCRVDGVRIMGVSRDNEAESLDEDALLIPEGNGVKVPYRFLLKSG